MPTSVLHGKADLQKCPTFLHIWENTPNRIACPEIEEAPLSESREPYPQQDCLLRNRRCIAPRTSRSRISLNKICPHSSHATSAFWIPQTTFSKCSDKVKTREPCSDHYIALTEKGKGTALPLAVGIIPIYVDLHPPEPGRPAKQKKNAQPFLTSEMALPI